MNSRPRLKQRYVPYMRACSLDMLENSLTVEAERLHGIYDSFLDI